MGKRQYTVGDKVWKKATKCKNADGTYTQIPRIKAVVTEVLPRRNPIAHIQEYRVKMLDAPSWYLAYFDDDLCYTYDGALVRRYR